MYGSQSREKGRPDKVGGAETRKSRWNAQHERDALSHIERFLKSEGYTETAKTLLAEAKGRGVVLKIEKHWQSAKHPFTLLLTGLSSVAGDKPDFRSWNEDADSKDKGSGGGAAVKKKEAELSDDSSNSDSDSSSDEAEAPVTVGQKRKREDGPVSSKIPQAASAVESMDVEDADSDSDSESPSDESDEPPLKRAKSAEKAIASESSDSDSDSSSSDSDSTKQPSVSKNSSRSHSKSDSSLDSDSSSARDESDSSSSSSSSSDSDSDSSSSRSPLPHKKKSQAKSQGPKLFSSLNGSAIKREGSTASSSETLQATSPVHSHPKEAKKEDTLLVHDKEEGEKHIPATEENIKKLKKDQTPFSRIPADTKVDPRFSSNKYVPYDYADRAYRDLSVTKGKGFTKEKNKKKRGSYRGGAIDTAAKAIKFED